MAAKSSIEVVVRLHLINISPDARRSHFQTIRRLVVGVDVTPVVVVVVVAAANRAGIVASSLN